MPYDYSDAPPPQFDLIPHGTTATVGIHIRAGGVGEDGMCKRSKDGGCEMLDVEFSVLDGTYKGRKFWQNMVLTGTTDGHAKAVDISRGMLKAILDSALGLKPTDVSAEARTARTVSLKQFEGMAFIAKIGIEKGAAKNDGGGGFWDDKNILAGVITPDRKDWHPVEQPPPFNGGGAGEAAAAPSAPAAAATPIERPKWADEPASS
jgi:hypothetical protein